MTFNQQQLEELETFLLGQDEAEPPVFQRRYDEDDAVTRLLDDALEADEWWVAMSPEERCTLSTASVSAGLWSGQLKNDVWVWREGMAGWSPVTEVQEFALIAALPPAPTPPPQELDEPVLDDPAGGRVRGLVMGLSATAIVALFMTMYAISAGAGGALP
jgi:uncharacterized protein DUF4339